jgi:Methyltransferase domain
VVGISQAYTANHLRRQREAHVRVDGYGRHRHLYLHDLIRRLAQNLRAAKPRSPLTWLDYGCGKGGFIDQIRPLGLFDEIAGYDPAVDMFSARPTSGSYDVVSCLDVLDVVEARFITAVLVDVAAHTAGLALFDHLTRPKAGTLKPHPPFYWAFLIGQHMAVGETNVEFPGMDGFERAVIIAAPRAAAP